MTSLGATRGWRLEERSALVTGSSSGVGRAIARTLAAAGAAVACVDVEAFPRSGGFDDDPDLPTDVGIRKEGGTAVFSPADVSVYVQMEAAFSNATERLGGIDIVVNNAGTAAWAPIDEESEEEYDRVMGVNAKGVWIGCKLACHSFLARGSGGRIVNVASIGGVLALPQEPAYCASKGAVVSLTKQIALDYGRHRIACNAVCPGPLETAMTRAFVADPESRSALEAVVPWPRLGHASDIANAVHFLASDASEWITGAVLTVDGGYSAH